MTALFLLVQVSAVEAADKKLENLNEFSVSDSRTVWRKKTDIDLFHFSYENAEGVVTAESGNGEKILAPGTEEMNDFRIHPFRCGYPERKAGFLAAEQYGKG